MGLRRRVDTPAVQSSTRGWLRTERIVPLGYALLSASYIVVSGWIVALLPPSIAQRVEILKGIGFVLVTALLLRSLLSASLRREHELRESLHSRGRALAAADRRAALGLLAASVGHELNNALFVLEANVGVLLEERKGFGDEEVIRDIDGTLTRLRRHGRQLLELGRPSAPKMIQVSLLQVVDDTVRLLQGTGRCKHMRVDFETRRPALVVGDPEGLSQIVMNLMLNAADATDGDGSVWLDVDERDGRCSLVVQDDGPGLEASVRLALFEAYVTTKGERGTGLGLMVSREIAHRHGGELTCEASSRGARFRLSLPSAVASDSPRQRAKQVNDVAPV